jgi:hypothetical protein
MSLATESSPGLSGISNELNAQFWLNIFWRVLTPLGSFIAVASVTSIAFPKAIIKCSVEVGVIGFVVWIIGICLKQIWKRLILRISQKCPPPVLKDLLMMGEHRISIMQVARYSTEIRGSAGFFPIWIAAANNLNMSSDEATRWIRLEWLEQLGEIEARIGRERKKVPFYTQQIARMLSMFVVYTVLYGLMKGNWSMGAVAGFCYGWTYLLMYECLGLDRVVQSYPQFDSEISHILNSLNYGNLKKYMVSGGQEV